MTVIEELKTMIKEEEDKKLIKEQLKYDIIYLWGRFELTDVKQAGSHLIFKSRGSDKGLSFRFTPLTVGELLQLIQQLEGELGKEIVAKYTSILAQLIQKEGKE